MAGHRTPLTIKQILAWADSHHKRTGSWPIESSGAVHQAPNENWSALSQALAKGSRGLPSGGSLAKLLAKHGRKKSWQTLPRLSIEQILAWADAHHKRTGKWPMDGTGPVHEAPNEKWSLLSQALGTGARGLPSGGSLAKLLAKHGRKRNRGAPPRLSIKQVLAWSDAHHKRTGQWPKRFSGGVYRTRDETWLRIDQAMRNGHRGFSGGQSLPKLLSERRGVRHYLKPPPLKVKQILTWADAHRRRTGEWPNRKSGDVYGSSGRPTDENWAAIDNALGGGNRGLDQTTLGLLLAEHRGVRHAMALPRLKLKDVLAWADAHRHRTGKWPTIKTGALREAPGETWHKIDSAFRRRTDWHGARWRGARTSLANILATHRNKRHPLQVPRLTFKQVLSWADDHHRRTGRYPLLTSGAVRGCSGTTWRNIQNALVVGYRGLRGNSSLAQLLEEHRGVRNIQRLPRLTIKQILKWADAHHKRTRRWPLALSGPIPRSGGETWTGIQVALSLSGRGLRSGNSIAKILDRHRGVRNNKDLPALRSQQILRWADSHHKRTGKWPTKKSGAVPQAQGEKWSAIGSCLQEGLRGLPRGSSLPRLLSKHRGVRNHMDLPNLSTKQILKWVDAYYKREKDWPQHNSGKIPGTNGERWVSINRALTKGTRGMSGGWSLARFLNRYRRPERGL